MVTCQSANQLKTPAKVSWTFKMVSQFGSLVYTITVKTADLTVVQKTIIDARHKEGKPQTFIAKEVVHRVLYPSMLTESWVEEKDAQPTERTAAYEDCQAKSIQEFGWTSQETDWDWGQEEEEEELDCCTVVQSPLFRWEQVLYFIWKPRS